LPCGKEASDGFDIVVEDVRPFGHHRSQGFLVALEVGNQHFHGTGWNQPANVPDGFRKDRRAPIRQFVAVHGGNDGMAQSQGLDRFRDS
jgi:hypothetical protein